MYHDRASFDLAAALPDRRTRARRAHRAARRPSERVYMLGETIDLVRPEEVMMHVQAWVEAGRKAVIANHNLHSLYLLRRDPGMRRFYDLADLVELDSAPLVLFGRMLKLSSRPFHRCTYLDWRKHFWSVASRLNWRVMYIGGADGVAAEAASRLKARYPGAVIETRSGYFNASAGSEGNAAMVQAVADFKPHILFVGMGMPRQERWIAENYEALPDCAIFSVGAAFDYEAGVQKAAPRWMGRLGMEWAFRLFADPKRLFTRYCVEPWFLVGPALADLRRAAARPA